MYYKIQISRIMSLTIDINKLSEEDKIKIEDELIIKIESGSGIYKDVKYIYPYELYNNDVIIPFSYGVNNLKIKRRDRDDFAKSCIKFRGKLREEQAKVRDEMFNILNKFGCVLLSAHVGFGKTLMSVYISCKMKLKTLIIIPNKVVLIEQWVKSYEKFCDNAKVQILHTKTEMDMDCDIYIINGINMIKKSRDFFKDIGCVIVDEAHLLVSEKMSNCLRYVKPRYLIGLTATPYRPDSFHKLLELYFSDRVVFRKLNREHIAYRVSTNFIPEYNIGNNGKVDWSSVLRSQAESIERNDIIIRIIQKFKDRVILVLCKRVNQANYLVKKLEELNEDVTSLIGTNKEFSQTSRILVATSSKAGVGFDHPALNCILLAGDLEEYFIQYLGRCMRTREGIPIIFDLVDKYSVLNSHWLTRRKVYIEHGGKVINFNREFPDFKMIN